VIEAYLGADDEHEPDEPRPEGANQVSDTVSDTTAAEPPSDAEEGEA
jgi:hypothetical protein